MGPIPSPEPARPRWTSIYVAVRYVAFRRLDLNDDYAGERGGWVVGWGLGLFSFACRNGGFLVRVHH